ncbi:YqhR family membrane protein [Neobacillus mesonae]|uniref:YqhR family membrane protein n=1 Tax=Neobacillus mesonae TaxID=1193713 RepID=UPI0025738A68|nr:YqhR family membrane protein [Neobacillus mesonae]MED4204373.1 YqhR family membrane protein [Neobacillus mesonae]
MTNENGAAKYPQPMSFPVMVFWTGLFGGVFWGTVGFITYYLNFTEIRPNVILIPWALGNWKYGWAGTVIAILLLGIISIGVAFIYSVLLKRFNGLWFGIGYGVILFFVVFMLLNPLFPDIKPLIDLNRNTIITSVCLYIIYGMFIGYSISYEYRNKIEQEKEEAS